MASVNILKPGDRARVLGYKAGSDSYRARLLSMGLTRNTEFTFLKTAPLGDPIEITLRGFKLSLRKAEAEVLEIENLGTQD